MGDFFMTGTPQAPHGELTPGMRDVGAWGGAWEQDATPCEYTSTHAVNASTAAYHADVAAKHAASLAQWVQYLSVTLGHLHNKVTELEDWKKKALEEVRKLREEHRVLRQRALGEEAEEPQEAAEVSALEPVRITPSMPGKQVQLLKVPSTDTISTVTPSASPATLSPASPAFGDIDAQKAEGVIITSGMVDGTRYELAEWCISHLSAKLRGCMGRALVSPPFAMLGLEDLRFMVCPDGKEVAQGPRSRRQKELYLKKITEGPLEACLKLKIPSCPAARELEFFLKVGSQRRGPFKHNFAESTVSECDDFGVDWLKQLDSEQRLSISVEIVNSGSNGGAGR
mmetsp:Transcript_47144/g.134548  ORF Transcript_47144/g.134548 Transcript_47144/m.134548 type:complete len:341 (-) Transcript_47144:92-1114(-)